MKPDFLQFDNRTSPWHNMCKNIENNLHPVMLRKLNTPIKILLGTFLIVLSVSLSHGQGETLTIDNTDAYPVKHRTAVDFPHELHMDEFECLDCHHDYADGENILDEGELEEGNPAIGCAACHDSTTEIDIKKAHHVQCIGCHRDMRKRNVAIGPELCGECHMRRSS